MKSGNHTQADCVCMCITGASLRGAHRRKQTRPGEQPARGSKPPPPPMHQGAPLMFSPVPSKSSTCSMWLACLCGCSVLSLATGATFLDHPCSCWDCGLVCESLGRCPKVVEGTSCPKDQYHQAAVCFCRCMLELCLSQTDCLVVWVIRKHPDHELFTICLACQALATALQHVLSSQAFSMPG